MGSFHVHVSGWEMLWGAAGMDTQYYINIYIYHIHIHHGQS